MQSHLSFTADEWDYVLDRRGLSLDMLLRPHMDHIVLGPVAVYKVIQSIVGMEKLFPLRAGLDCVFSRERDGALRLPAPPGRRLARPGGGPPRAVHGTAREVTLWPVNMSFAAAMAAGIAALLALEIEDRRGDATACGLLVLGLAFSELAPFFLVGAAVSMVLARRPWSRA